MLSRGRTPESVLWAQRLRRLDSHRMADYPENMRSLRPICLALLLLLAFVGDVGTCVLAAPDACECQSGAATTGDVPAFTAPEAVAPSEAAVHHTPVAVADGAPVERVASAASAPVAESCDLGPVAAAPPRYLSHCAFLC